MEPKDKNPEELMTAQEAAQAFIDAGLSEPTFRRRVHAKQIDSFLPEGRRRGALYPRSQVLAAIGVKSRKNRKRRKSTVSIKPSTFSQATPQDMVEIASLLISFYTSRISVEKRAAWIERNPEIAFVLRSEGKAVGCAFIMPLTEEKIFQILSSQVKPPTRPHEILLYEPGKHVSLYVRAVGVLQAVSKEQRRHWAARLITGLAKAIIGLGTRGIYIEKIYAQGDTKAGERALRSIGFMQIEINALTTRKNYMLDVTQSGSVFAMRYKHALNTWRALNEEE
jgi:hypothetical protein